MKATSITISILCAILSFLSFSQVQNSGSNYTFNDFKKEPIIRYSSVDNKKISITDNEEVVVEIRDLTGKKMMAGKKMTNKTTLL